MKERPEMTASDPEADKLYKTSEVAELFGVTNETVRDWIREKKLPAVRIGSGHYRVRRSDLLAFANSQYGPKEAAS